MGDPEAPGRYSLAFVLADGTVVDVGDPNPPFQSPVVDLTEGDDGRWLTLGHSVQSLQVPSLARAWTLENSSTQSSLGDREFVLQADGRVIWFGTDEPSDYVREDGKPDIQETVSLWVRSVAPEGEVDQSHILHTSAPPADLMPPEPGFDVLAGHLAASNGEVFFGVTRASSEARAEFESRVLSLGASKWQWELPDGVFVQDLLATPDGRVLVVGSNPDGRQLFLLDGNGTREWSHDLGGDSGIPDLTLDTEPVSASLTPDGHVVIGAVQADRTAVWFGEVQWSE